MAVLSMERDEMIERFVYVGICFLVILAVFHIQRSRYMEGACSPFCLYTIVAMCAGWEGIDAALYGSPGFPASRWFLMPALAGALGWEAFADWNGMKARGK